MVAVAAAHAADDPEAQAADRDTSWSYYGGDAAGTRYSSATQIDRRTVSRLQLAWSFRTGAAQESTNLIRKAAFEATPILADDKLFLTTPYSHVLAVDAASGHKLWEFNPGVDLKQDYSEVTSRGVSVWLDTHAKIHQACRLRVFAGTLDARLFALDAQTGKPCRDFGARGFVDLTHDVALAQNWRGGYELTSPPAIYRDLVIVGSSIADNWRVDTERGIVRAYDARTGKLRWTWNPTPWADRTEPRTGGGNAWSAFAVDPESGLVFVPTGSSAPDYFGGLRPGDDKWADSVVALRAETGEFVWGFQVVHHDLWDYDVASQPMLIRWRNDTPAVIVNTKMGHVFVLDRMSGAPLLPVEERPVPQSDVPGETSAPTQPFPSIALVPEQLSADDAWGPTPEDAAWCREKIRSLRWEGIFTPPSIRGSLAFPGNVGGVNWGSAAYDPVRHLMVANTNRLIAWSRLIPRAQFESETNAQPDNRIFGEFARQLGAPFGLYRSFLFSPSKLPCNAPPWGTTEAVDIYSGKRLWDVPLGTLIPGQQTGAINLGGPIVVAGGLVFTAAAMDPHLHAFDIDTGHELWSYELPASAQSTPMTFVLNGRQYLVIAAGGHGKLGTTQGDYLLAFALPDTP
jgi:quinoprotein glucose dehydrogenase